MDPLAEDFPNWTPYHYVHNNPINLIDPTGMSAESYDQDPPVLRNPTETTVSDADKAKVIAYSTELSEITIYANKKSEQSWVGSFFSNLFSAFSNGVNFTMDGGKESPYRPPVSRNAETVDMTILMVFGMDVFGPETFMPGAAPDGSNPLKQGGGERNELNLKDSVFPKGYLPVGYNWGVPTGLDSVSVVTKDKQHENDITNRNKSLKEIYMMYLKDSVNLKNSK